MGELFPTVTSLHAELNKTVASQLAGRRELGIDPLI